MNRLSFFGACALLGCTLLYAEHAAADDAGVGEGSAVAVMGPGRDIEVTGGVANRGRQRAPYRRL